MVSSRISPRRGLPAGAAVCSNDYGACTRPAPTSLAGNGKCFAVATSFARKAAPRKAALLWAQSAAHPATCGVAMLVPLMVLCKVGLGQDENTLTPGPAMSTFPPSENMATFRALSSAATDIIVGEFPGAPAGLIVPNYRVGQFVWVP